MKRMRRFWMWLRHREVVSYADPGTLVRYPGETVIEFAGSAGGAKVTLGPSSTSR